MHQAKGYPQDLHQNVPLDWILHHTPSGYMDRDGWLKSMTQLRNICDASPIKNQILLFDLHVGRFNDGELRKIMCKNIQPFILKSGNSTNDQPNDNGPNAKLKSLYSVTKSEWMMKYGTKFFHLTT